MSIESHFRINVARRVKPDTARFGPYFEHFFATNVTDGRKAEEVAHSLRGHYPAPDWKVEVTYWEVRGSACDL